MSKTAGDRDFIAHTHTHTQVFTASSVTGRSGSTCRLNREMFIKDKTKVACRMSGIE